MFVDVYAPSHATASSNLPVFFFIQGGGFVTNSNSNYNGSGLIEASGRSIIVVNFNYRVGPYGFLANGNHITPNNGLWDQVKALEWVQKHISKFGGDPKHVVIGGDSAGAASVSYHLTRDKGKDQGLFVGAAAESVSFSTLLTTEESQYLYDSFAIRAGCATADSLSCLMSKSTYELQSANVNVQPLPGAQNPQLFAWNPVLDGDFISEITYDAYMKGHFVRVPIIVGDDTNGGTTFAPSTTTTIPQMNTFLHDQFPLLTLTDLETIDKLYPNMNQSCPEQGCRWRQVSTAYGQMRYMCPGLYINQQYATYGSNKSWAYQWNVEDPAQISAGLGVPHTVEVHAIFGPSNTNGGAPSSYYPGSINSHAVTVAQGYWISFIKKLNPNTHRAANSPEWTPYSPNDRRRIVVNSGGKAEMTGLPTTLQDSCSFFGDIGSRIKQ